MQNGDQSFITSGINANTGITTSHSIGTNYRDEWGRGMSVYGSYTYTNRDNEVVQQTSTQNFFQSSSFLNNQSQNSDTRSGNHRFYFNFEYQIDSFNYI